MHINYTSQYERTKQEVQGCNEVELCALFRNWMHYEHYLGLQWIKDVVDARLAAGTLNIDLVVNGFRNGRTGEVEYDKPWLNGLFDGIRAKHPELFTPAAAKAYARRIPANRCR